MRQIPLHEPEFDVQDEQAVIETLRLAWVSTGGPKVVDFERALAKFVGSKHAISVSNGTVGLSLMLVALAREQQITGQFVVLVPNLSFIATANAVVHAGGVPIFFDSMKKSFNPGCVQIAEILSAGFHRSGAFWIHNDSRLPLLAIMPAHIMGWCGDIKAISEFCLNNGIPLLEDAAESLGSYFSPNEHLGKSGVAACFSFNGNKILTTGGGGVVITEDDSFARRLKHLSTTAKVDGLRFVHDEIGFNYRLVNILAALGCSQLRKLPDRLLRKREIFDTYKSYFAGNDCVEVYEEKSCVSNNWLVNLIFDEPAHRECALIALNEQGIQARPLWTPNHLQPAYRDFNQVTSLFSNSTEIWERALSVPSSPQLPNEAIAKICEIVVTSNKKGR